MVTLNKRQIGILSFLKERNDYITISEIARNFDVSVRTVRNDLDSLGDILKKYSINLEKKPRTGIRLVLKEGQSIHEILDRYEYKIYTAEDRALMICLLLMIKGKATLEELGEDLQVSKNTLVQDFKLASIKLEEYGIKVSKKSFHGIWISDSEEKIREVFLKVYKDLTMGQNVTLLKFLINNSSLSDIKVKSLIEMVEEKSNIRYSHESLEELEIATLFVFSRINNGFIINYNSDLIKEVEKEIEYLTLKETLEEFTKSKIISDEVYYLLKIFKGAKRTIGKLSCDDEGNIYSITTEVLKDICEVINTDYSLDEEFIKQVAMHLNVAIYRVKNNLNINNPMLEEIKYKMSFVYSLTEKILSDKKDIIGVEFPEGEIAYMAMYFDTLFEKSIKSNFSCKILVVCNGGLATSGLLKARMNVMIPEANIVNICSIRDVYNFLENGDIDFIVTTVPIKVEGYKVIQVNPLLELLDSEKIKAEIYNKRYEKNCKFLIEKLKVNDKSEITKLIPEKYTQLNIDIKDWREAIEVATRPLILDKKIKKEYKSEIIRVIETLGNYMVFIPEIAFVHATPENVIENSISLLTLRSPINFGSKNQVKVKAIVVLANKEENMNLINLINILKKEGNIKRFKEAKKYDEIENII